jgi:hypothetical protein
LTRAANSSVPREARIERVFNPDRKDTHWGKGKPKRDE